MTEESFELVDLDETCLYMCVFPHTEYPRIVFDDQKVDYEVPAKGRIADTAFCDDRQARSHHISGKAEIWWNQEY